VSTSHAQRVLALLLAAALQAGLAGCQPAEVVVPYELVGVWRTRAPQYADRFLEFTEHGLIFGRKDERPAPRPIHAIELTREPGRTLYLVSYRNEHEQDYTLAFYFEWTDGGVITFKHQQHWQWLKEE
jgi:hypothetical protein